MSSMCNWKVKWAKIMLWNFHMKSIIISITNNMKIETKNFSSSTKNVGKKSEKSSSCKNSKIVPHPHFPILYKIAKNELDLDYNSLMIGQKGRTWIFQRQKAENFFSGWNSVKWEWEVEFQRRKEELHNKKHYKTTLIFHHFLSFVELSFVLLSQTRISEHMHNVFMICTTSPTLDSF